MQKHYKGKIGVERKPPKAKISLCMHCKAIDLIKNREQQSLK
jgi:hypothetical protein